MKPLFRQWAIALLAIAGSVVAAPVFADPPTRVARLNYVKGSVSFRPASVEEWAPASLNYPLTTGDHLWTDTESWAELHVGSTAIRLAPSTAFAFLNLDDRETQMSVSEGALDVRVRDAEGSNGIEIDTPSAAISLTRPGIYRVDVLPDGGSTRVTVRFGAAAVTADGPDFWLRDGESASIYGTDESVSHEVFRAAPPDSWERWCRSRDEREDQSASLRYVSYEMTGYEDLDDYGSWVSTPDYGWGWRPRVAVGWSPYRYGQWRWVYPWGWTWVDDAPWGFAPFHYGRWACLHNSWYWFPGHYAVRPVYAPALVAFIGGDHWGLSFGFGRSHVGWFPLAPGEFWMPHYHASHGYIRNLNVTNVNITNVNITNYDISRGSYVNRAMPGGVTAVPRDVFMGGRAVARSALGVDTRSALRAQVIGTSAPVAPRLDSVTGGARAISRPTSSALDRAVVARSRPPAAPVPFAAQERALQASGGRPLDDSTLQRLRAESGRRVSSEPVRVAGARTAGGERRRTDAVENGQGAPASSGAGIATRRSGERPVPDAARPGSDAPRGVPGAAARPEVNDRPSWARPRTGSDQPGSAPGYERGGPGIRTRSGAPAEQDQGEARPRYGERQGASGGDTTSQPTTHDRPGQVNDRPGQVNDRPGRVRPSGEDNNSRPGAAGVPAGRPGTGGARSRGGESRPAPDSKAPATARPRGGGGDTSFNNSSVGTWTNDRPAPQYRAVPESRPAPEYRAAPESRPAPQYRAVPESRPTPQYRAVPESRPAPEYRAAPESRPAPEYRGVPRSAPQPSSGGAVERRGGGGGQQASPQHGSPSGGQAVPRGGARNRGN